MAETSFGDLKDQIQEIINETVKSHLEDKIYKAENVKGWCEEIIRDILKKLSDKKFQPFKYLANCLVLSKRSNGVHTVTMSLWDPQNDGSVTNQWVNDTMQCITTVWGLKY
ncbi:dynein light chain Tctex-type 1 [Histomonas meleagridis]|uniref:dynein light chain Tctex-type 1 n=1 Tax=Histomonas meleagridis TaxID=135588 RepID=UPI00355961E3|nr:dynein light chain Tctex-type 1 [Histomonas meleagridis]KAH0800591.1 dynein light chain Tctex-type 1 [Histomonas meleagridis]